MSGLEPNPWTEPEARQPVGIWWEVRAAQASRNKPQVREVADSNIQPRDGGW